jgi:RecJ-like exonuclease
MRLSDRLLKKIASLPENTKIYCETECPQCEGCGKITNTEEKESWKHWADIPIKSAQAVILGIVKPIPCPKCNGKAIINLEL